MSVLFRWKMEARVQINFNYVVCLTNAESIKTLAQKLKSSDTAR